MTTVDARPLVPVQGGAASVSLQKPRATSRKRGRGHRKDFQRTIVLIPAHNEEEQIAAAIESVLAQTYRAALVVVIGDNCTDSTLEIARRYPVEVMETVGNRDRKAGALNQAWQKYGQDARFVVTMDADTILDSRCLELLRAQAVKDPKIGGICGRPLNKVPPAGMSAWSSVLWRLLALDFAMYDQVLIRRKYATEVLGGFGSLFRNRALRDVAAVHGNPWAVDSIVEDYRLSLHLREADWKIRVAPAALAYTDTPVTIRALWRQRLRWSGGTFEELVRAGWKPWTRRNWLSYSMIWLGILLRIAMLVAWGLIVALDLPLQLEWYYALPFLVSAADRLVVSLKMRHSNWLNHLLAVAVLPLELMTLMGQCWSIRSTWLVLRKKPLSW